MSSPAQLLVTSYPVTGTDPRRVLLNRCADNKTAILSRV
jgi:hypothetical protein